MTAFLILAGLVLVGIIFAVVSMLKSKDGGVSVTPISPDQFASEGILSSGKFAPAKPAAPLKSQPTATVKDKPKKSGGLFGGFSKKPAEKTAKPPLKGFLGKFKADPERPHLNMPPEETLPAQPKKKSGFALPKLSNILPFGKKKKTPLEQNVQPIPSFKETVKKEPPFFKTPGQTETPSTGTASLKISAPPAPPPSPPPIQPKQENFVSKEMEATIEKEIHLTTELEELKGKFERTEKMFTEKAKELEKSQSQLDTELKNKREFNKIKDLLEKELSDTKDRTRKVQVELTSTKTEAESYKKRINQLEEKVTKLEKELLKKDDEAIELNRRLQQAPPASAVPPAAPKPEPAAPAIPEEKPAPVEAQEPQPPAAQPTQMETQTPEPPTTAPVPEAIIMPEKQEPPAPEIQGMPKENLPQPPQPPAETNSNPDNQTTTPPKE